jgi:soluble lytic murein transglycosylase-like protein
VVRKRRAGLDTSLVLGLIQVESGFRKYAISSAGARGYMQVMPFWARVIGDGDAAQAVPHADQPALRLRDPAPLPGRERGDLFMALGRYNGSRGKPPYPDAVMANRQRWLP